ncbi:MAG: electron transfer flavoprotein alpha subunit, partial [Candidatus Azotimanducaceae bacterium]
MSNLVVADHNNEAINASTLVAIAAAKAIGGDIDVLVA